jgi:hypothetical protein
LAILLRFWRNRKERARLAERDADALWEKFGSLAHKIASRMADKEEGIDADPRLPKRHWKRVRRVLSKKTRGGHGRYLLGDGWRSHRPFGAHTLS